MTPRPNADDKRQIGKAKRKEEVLALREAVDLRDVLALPAGRRLIWRWIGDHGVFHTSFRSNALEMAFREGRRDIGLRMLAEVEEASPDLFLQMQQEAVAIARREDDIEKRNEALDPQDEPEENQ